MYNSDPEMDTRIDVKEESISDESISDEYLQSGMHFSKTCQVIIPVCESDTKTKIKEEVHSEMKLNNEVDYFKECEFNTAIKSDGSEMVIKNEIKKQPEPKRTPELVALLSARLESGSNSFPSELLEFIINGENDTYLYSDNKLNVKMEIKEEEWWLERNPAEITTQFETFPTSVPLLQNLNKDLGNMIDEDWAVADLPSIGSNTTLLPSSENFEERDCIKKREDNNECKNADVCKSPCSILSVSEKLINCKHSSSTYVSDLKKNHLIGINKELHQCDVCEKTFTQLPHLKRHYFTHEDIKPYTCEICDKTFSQLSNLRKHKLTHEDSKPYNCGTCNKRFSRMSNLKRHNSNACKSAYSKKCLVSSESDQPLICEHSSSSVCSKCSHGSHHNCEKSLNCASGLKKNDLIGVSKKLHSCKICEKTFTELSHLKTHYLIHEGIRPFKCNICGKSFSQLSNLKRHNLMHEGIKPFSCQICDKTFSSKSHLKTHNLTHEGKKPYTCQICEKHFSLRSNLKAHYKIHTR